MGQYTPSDEYRDGSAYASLSAGATFLSDSDVPTVSDAGYDNNISFDVGVAGHVALGKYFGPFRAEAEFGYVTNEVDEVMADGFKVNISDYGTVRLSSFSLMANGYFDFAIHDNIDLYIGGGIGAALMEGKLRGTVPGYGDVNFDDTDLVFAYQGMGGVAFRLTDNMHLNVGYRYKGSENPTFDDVEFKSPGVHIAEVGLRFSF